MATCPGDVHAFAPSPATNELNASIDKVKKMDLPKDVAANVDAFASAIQSTIAAVDKLKAGPLSDAEFTKVLEQLNGLAVDAQKSIDAANRAEQKAAADHAKSARDAFESARTLTIVIILPGPALSVGLGTVSGYTLDPTTGKVTLTPGTAIQPGAQTTTIGGLGKLFGLDILGALDLGETDGQVTTLANPNLTALSGETGSFLAGGEIPILISQGFGAVSVEYKQYGVSLSYTPTVLADGRISLRVRPVEQHPETLPHE